MPKNSPEFPLSTITRGWKAKTETTYFNGELRPELAHQVFPVRNIIGPPGKPRIFTLDLPPSFERGPLANFQPADIKAWIPPDHSDQERFPHAPYYPNIVYEHHAASVEFAVERCEFVHPIRFSSVYPNGFEALDPAQATFAHQITQSLIEGGHTQDEQPNPDTDLIFYFDQIPQTGGDLLARMPETPKAILRQISNQYMREEGNHQSKYIGSTVGVITVPEDLSQYTHEKMQDIIWGTMAKRGALKFIFISTDAQGNAKNYTYATMEPGHPLFDPRYPQAITALRNAMVVHACTTQSERALVTRNHLTQEQFLNCPTIDHLINFGRQWGERKTMDLPIGIGKYQVSTRRENESQAILGWTGQSPGAMAARAPLLDEFLPGGRAYIITATGRDETDKTNMAAMKGDLITVNLVEGKTHAYGVEGIPLKETSVEATELVAVMENSPDVTLTQTPDGLKLDPQGKIKSKFIRAVLHIHFAVEEILPYIINGQAFQVIEHIPTNWEEFQFPLGCGKHEMEAFTTDLASRAGRIATAAYGIAYLPNHGLHIFCYNRPLPGTDIIPEDPTEALQWLEQQGFIKLTKEIPQIPNKSTHFKS